MLFVPKISIQLLLLLLMVAAQQRRLLIDGWLIGGGGGFATPRKKLARLSHHPKGKIPTSTTNYGIMGSRRRRYQAPQQGKIL
jgi:hypothetical protein